MTRPITTTLLLLLSFIPSSFTTATTYNCPPVNTTTTLPAGQVQVSIRSTSAKNELCTLVHRKISSNNNNSGTKQRHYRTPVARSYAGREWEKSAGLFARSGSGLVVNCTSSSTAVEEEEGVCELTLPSLSEGMEEYVLESFVYEVSAEVEAARFLEQATFGQTRQDIDALVATSNDFASWIHTQMYSTAPSYHREFLRRNTHPKFEYPYRTGTVGARPCEQYSRWRRYAITSRDVMDDRNTGRQKHLTIEQQEVDDNNEEGILLVFVWKVDGTFRTVTQDHPTFTDGVPVELNVRYRIDEMRRSFYVNCVGCRVLVRDSTTGKEYYIPNPAVSIEGVEGNEDLLPYSTVSLPAFGSNEFPAVEKASVEFPLFTSLMKDDENGLLNSTSLEGSTQCDGFPSFRQPEAVAVPTEDAPLSILPTVFGRSINQDTGVEEVFAYDPHLFLYENTPENPITDGGGKLVIETYDPMDPGYQVICQNAHRTYDNEEGCQLSYLDTACAPDSLPKETIVLDSTNLEGIRALTGKSLYAVTGLTIHEDLNAEDGALVSSVLDEESILSIEGCNSWSRGRATKDRTTEKFWCDRSGLQNISSSIVFSPPKPRLSIVHKLRMYTQNTAVNADPAGFVLEGRVKPDAPWEIIGLGDLDMSRDRNERGLPIESTYESGDVNFTYTEVSLSNNTKAYWDYKLSIPGTRRPTQSNLQFAEVELPGLLFPTFPTSFGCLSGARRSRWVKEVNAENCDNTADLGESTYKLFSDLISAKPDVYNPHIRTVTREFRECDSNDMYKLDLGMVQASDGTCWKHVHDFEGTIFDLSAAEPADYNYTVAGSLAHVSNEFVDSISNNPDYPIVGLLDDHVDMSDSPRAPLNQQDVQDAFVTIEYNPSGEAVVICGSPSEVATDPFASDHSFDITTPQRTGTRTMSIWELSAQRHTTWTQMAMHADDQLRQRQSWALSQIIAVGLPGSGRVFYEVNEPYPSFYDQYVRNGFGSYRKLLKDMSFNVIMSEWLSFINNKSLQYNVNNGFSSHPDENYAREIMQLFSIGLFELNMDGSQVLDEEGKAIETYTIDDIMSYASAWTGFQEREARGGVAASSRGSEHSLDPLYINPDTRDLFPKSNLHNGFIGDQVVLCQDLPQKAFLRKGATYKILGSDPTPTMLSSDAALENDSDRPIMELLPSSPLFAKLCSRNSDGDCTFSSNIILEENLFYDDAAKLGIEYKVDTLRTVQMKIGLSHPIYYEYIQQPCVEYSFYSDAKNVFRGQIHGEAVQDNVMCADPTLPVATSMCLVPGSEQSASSVVQCTYSGERMTYGSAVDACEENGLKQGTPYLFKKQSAGPCVRGSSLDFRSWTESPCQVKVKVSLEAGNIAIVHSPSFDHGGMKNVETSVGEASRNSFKTPWTGNSPSLNDCLSIAACNVYDEEYCICDTEIATNNVYTSSSEISSIADLKYTLHVGAADPMSFDDGYYTNLGNCGIDGLLVYSSSTSGDCSSFSTDTVFSFEWKSKQLFLKNVKSEVYILGSDFAFRNPVQFNSLVQPEVRDMYHETDEVIDSLFYHPSHPPFLAMRLSQRFGLSNPSPSLIERLATAYANGSYEANNLQFGSGKYGDLGALVAAILLDPESREAVLDADQSHGHAKAPLDKVISVFRSMGLEFESPLAIPTLLDLQDKIGQGSFESPSVFNFYLVEYAHPGVIQNAGLFSPETMLYQGYRLLYFVDAMSNTVKFGINDCPRVSRFEGWRNASPFQCTTVEGITDYSPAHFSYWPSSVESVQDILDELSLLLTGGRLGGSNMALIASLVQPIFDTGDIPKAVRAAQQYILTAPEAHTTGMARISEELRPSSGYESKPRGSYKALVFLNMGGGLDSFNLIAPKGLCDSGDGYAAYAASRGNAIPLHGLTSISAEDQDCKEFGVHSDFSLLADLYNQTIFFANIGSLKKPLTRHDNWNSGHLFAHNSMQHILARGDPYDEAGDTGVFGRLLDMLKKKGHHTSANNLKGDKQMLQGFPEYQSTIVEVTLSSPSELNKYATVTDLFDVARQLNGVGEVGNSFFSEAWAESLSAALYDHDQILAAAAAGIEVTDYPLNGESSLSKGLNAIANHMLSRDFRNVNRDIYVLREGGFDMHKSSEGLSPAFQDMSLELGKFINEMKRQGIWEDVVIVMGSEFGRSIPTNSGGGTDHGWGGNSFMIGGSVNGGKVLGDYPHPLDSAHLQYVKGRMIPSTPWESVWNGISQWLGVRNDEDLDRVLPNRKSFGQCDHFTDKDLFLEGACDCTVINGTCTCQCDEVTYSPTVSPTVSPSQSPSTDPTSHPSALPSVVPSTSPTLTPTTSPTVDLPDEGVLVSSIIDSDSSYVPFGCNSWSRAYASIDGSLERFHCDRTDLYHVPAGQIFSTTSVQASIAKKVRVYPSDRSTGLDPIDVTLEGRVNPESEWQVIGSGDLLYSNNNARNIRSSALLIKSTFESGDLNYTFAEVTFPNNKNVYSDYKVSFSRTRNYDSTRLQFAEVEIPGMLLPPPPTPPPTLSPTASIADDAQAVNTVLYPGSVESFGCSRARRAYRVLSPTTDKFICDHIDMPKQDGLWVSGFTVSPSHRKLSIAKELRLYTHNNCVNCDCVDYLLEGRVTIGSDWQEIGSGDFPWRSAAICRNARGLQVHSTFESGDDNLCYESVSYPSHATAYLDYKFTCRHTRGNHRYFQLARIEVAGYLLG